MVSYNWQNFVCSCCIPAKPST